MSQIKPRVAIGSLGGTIAMAPGADGVGVKPALNAEDLIAAVPGLGDVAEIRAESIQNLASPSITFPDLVRALEFARQAVDDGAAGVVLTHGTDTLEESAYFLDLFWDRPEPIVVTGAMRSSKMLSADGPANIYAATLAAVCPALRDYGVLTCLDDEVNLAKYVTKAHANAMWTFTSREWGPVARQFEGRIRVGAAPARRDRALPLPTLGEVEVPMLESGLESNRKYIDAIVAAGVKGIVIAGSGVGHIPVPVADVLEETVAAGIPVVIATRQGAGTTGTCSYSYPGSEMDAIRRGAIMAGYLSPRKARILLWALTASGASIEEIREEFAVRGE